MGAAARRSVNKQSMTTSTSREPDPCDDGGETLKPGTRSLFQPVQRASKLTNSGIRDSTSSRRLHIDHVLELTIQEGIIYIHLRDGPLPNNNNQKSANNGHVSNMSKGLIIVMTILLLKSHIQQDKLCSAQENHLNLS